MRRVRFVEDIFNNVSEGRKVQNFSSERLVEGKYNSQMNTFSKVVDDDDSSHELHKDGLNADLWLLRLISFLFIFQLKTFKSI